jgi:hypothetical protein
MMDNLGLVVFAGAVAGSFAATMIPYWQKLRETPELIFEKKFLGTAVWAIATSLGMSFWIFTTLLENAQTIAGATSLGAIFIMTAVAAYGINVGTNKFITSVTPPDAKPLTDKSKENKII